MSGNAIQRKVLLFALFFVALASLIVVPQVLAESTIHVGPGGTTGCALGGCPLYKSEVNALTTNLDLFMTSGGTPTLDSPIWLIFAVPNGGTLSSTSVSGAFLNDVNNSYLPTPISIGFLGKMGTMGTGQDVYGQLGLKINSSNNFSNYSQWDFAVNHLSVSNFNLYVFTLNTNDFDAKDFLNVNVGGIPLGTFDRAGRHRSCSIPTRMCPNQLH